MSSTISLNDRNFIEGKLKKIPGLLSEFSFANLYLFRKAHKYRLEGDFLLGETYDKKAYRFPLNYPFEPEKGEVYFPVPEEEIAQFSSHYFNEDDSDYLYEREKLASMSGRKLSAKRSHLYRFEEDYDPELRPFDPEASIKVLEAWQKGQPSEKDFDACLEGIELFETFNFDGFTVFSGKEPVGFIISERYKEEASIFHFCKVVPGIKGVTPFLYRAMAHKQDAKVKWINLEQDLGIKGLRCSKYSYQPVTKLKKYFVELK